MTAQVSRKCRSRTCSQTAVPTGVLPPSGGGVAVGGVPGVVTADPGQTAREGGAQVVKGPGYDHVVVKGHEIRYETLGHPYT